MNLRAVSYCLTLIALIAAFATSTAVHVAPAAAAPVPVTVDSNGAVGGQGTAGGFGLPSVGGQQEPHYHCRGSACGIPASEWAQHCRAFPNLAGCKKTKPEPIDMTAPCANGPQHVGYCLPPAPPGAQLPVSASDQARQDYCLAHTQDPSCGHDGSGTIADQIDRFSIAMKQCDAGDAVDCDYIHTHTMPVLDGSSTGSGGGFIQMIPVKPDPQPAFDTGCTPED